MDSTKTTPTVPLDPQNTKLGEGSFGKVFATKCGKIDSATKHVKLNFGDMDQPYIHETTLREYAALTQCGGGYVPKLTKAAKFDVANDKLELTMTNGGITLLSFAKTIPYLERIKFVPSLIYQLAQGLLQLQNSGILHGDVKPDNILVDPKTKRIRIIDFGITTFIQENTLVPSYIDVGTYVYCPIETFKNNEAYATSCVWNIAMSVWDFLYKGYGGAERFVWDKNPLWSSTKKDLSPQKKMREVFVYLEKVTATTGTSKLDISENVAFEDLKKVYPTVHQLICKMIDMNPETRISLKDICSDNLLLSVHRPSYVRLPKLRTTMEINTCWKTNNENRESQLNSLLITASMTKATKYFPLAALLLDSYLSKVSIAQEKLYLAGLSCLSIAIALSDNCEELSDNLMTNIFRPYKLQDLFNMNLHIVQTLKGRIYYKTFVVELYEKYGAVNYNTANRVILAVKAPYTNQTLIECYEASTYAKY